MTDQERVGVTQTDREVYLISADAILALLNPSSDITQGRKGS